MKLKLNLLGMREMERAFRALDGYERVVMDGDRERVVTEYHALGATRLDIAKNLNKLKAALSALEEARVALVRECKGGPGDLSAADPKWPRFVAEFEAMANREEEIKLVEIRRDDLRLDRNQIPVLVLATLAPIIV